MVAGRAPTGPPKILGAGSHTGGSETMLSKQSKVDQIIKTRRFYFNLAQTYTGFTDFSKT
jgi:hypothetical protein